jgi:mRNA interferase MazF
MRAVTQRLSALHFKRRQQGADHDLRSPKRSSGWLLARRIEPRCESFGSRCRNSRPKCPTDVVRGEVFRLPSPRGARGREQRGARYAVVVQADEFMGLSTTLVSPTSTSAHPATFRPVITLDGNETQVLVEQTTVVDPQRLGRSAGRLDADELRAVDDALALVLGL